LHFDAAVEFHRVLWYAARRAGLHLDRDYFDDFDTAARRRAQLLRACTALHCSVEQVDALVDRVRAERYAQGEKLQHVGETPEGIRIIMSGLARMNVETGDGAVLPIIDLQRDELVGLTSLTRQGINASVQAVTEVEALMVPVDVLDELVAERPELARDIGREIDNRRRLVVEAFTAAAIVLPLSSRAIAY
jgi:CRP-like cAMP-binding protein